jgi:hypothetical protein
VTLVFTGFGWTRVAPESALPAGGHGKAEPLSAKAAARPSRPYTDVAVLEETLCAKKTTPRSSLVGDLIDRELSSIFRAASEPGFLGKLRRKASPAVELGVAARALALLGCGR